MYAAPPSLNASGGNASVAATPNLAALCLSEAQMQMYGPEFEKYLQRYLFPCLAIFGILGNALNLTVLLNKRMRTRANTFLAMLAIADVCFLSLLLPNVLANYPLLTYNYYYRWFYLHAKVHLLSFANWASGVAIWCVIAVCTDRLIGIRNPLYVRSHVSSAKMCALLAAIVGLPGLLTAYQHFAYACPVRSFCNGTQLYSKCLPVTEERWFGNQTNPHSRAFRRFIDYSTVANITAVIIAPIILLTILNTMLLCALRKRSTHLLMNGGSYGGGALMASGSEREGSSAAAKPQDYLKHHKTEQRVTLTVAFIVTMFTATNGPSAVVHLLAQLYGTKQRDWYNVTLVCSTLVIFGKASNFILFCLGSKHFRKRLFSLAQKKIHEKLDVFDTRRRSSTCVTTILANITTPSRKNTAASLVKNGAGSTKHRPSRESLF